MSLILNKKNEKNHVSRGCGQRPICNDKKLLEREGEKCMTFKFIKICFKSESTHLISHENKKFMKAFQINPHSPENQKQLANLLIRTFLQRERAF